MANAVCQRGRRNGTYPIGQHHECANTYVERTICIRENTPEVMNKDFPVTSSSRQIATIWGEGNRAYVFSGLDDGVNVSESR